MKEPGRTAVLEGTRDSESDESGPPVRPHRIDEEFALLMTACVRVAQTPLPNLSEGGSAGGGGVRSIPAAPAPESWRAVDGTVTDGTLRSVDGPARTRFTTEIVHRELGPMAVTVERVDGGVRVVFEVADAIARVAVEMQRAALLSSLYAAGAQVASVIVAIRSGGTALAPRFAVTKTKKSEQPEDGSAGKSPHPSSLDLVG